MRKTLLKFITSAVVIIISIGFILIIIGQTDALAKWFPNEISVGSPLSAIIKSIGAVLLGSGVFTAIIKSSEYTQVFSSVFEEIIWSKKFISKRGDKREIWGTVTRLMYEEKFPLISSEIEEIITSQYLPTLSDFYVQDYEMLINVTEHSHGFWKHHETIKFTIIPTSAKLKIEHKLTTSNCFT